MNEAENLAVQENEIPEGGENIENIEKNENIENHQENPVEDRAYKMGWVPKDQFKGKPELWRPAEEFVERGETLIPFLNKKIRKLEKQQIEKDKSFSQYLGDMREKLHSQKVDDHEARKRQAVDASRVSLSCW